MKTFKLVSLKIISPIEVGKCYEVPLIDGLVINKEDTAKHWLLEAYVDKSEELYFSKLMDENKTFKVKATITRKDNDPATFQSTIQSIRVLEENVSVLLNCQLVGKEDISESLLSELIDQGLDGSELLKEFKNRLTEKKSKTV